jgi:hypothetical protein
VRRLSGVLVVEVSFSRYDTTVMPRRPADVGLYFFMLDISCE